MKQICIYLFLILIPSVSLSAKDFNIKEYGAIGDGMTLNTVAIQKTIDAAHNEGKSRVIVPAGTYLTGSINLKSGVNLHLSEGSILLGSLDFADHKKVDKTYMRALVMGSYQDDISITGKGTIDGQGRAAALKTDSLFTAGALDMKYYNTVENRPRFYMRPMLIVFVGCKNIEVRDVRLKNSASWVQCYDRCENLIIKGIHVDSDAYWNNDGIDIADCKNVYLGHSYFNSADDGICIKSHHAEYLVEDMIVEHCTVRSSASAVKFGTKSIGGFKNVTVRNIKIFDTFRSAIAIESVDGGILENILIDSIEAINTGNAIFIKLGHREPERTVGNLKNVQISNIKVQVAFERPDYAYDLRGPELPFFHNIFPSSITGMPDYYIENLKLENIEIQYPGRGNKALAYAPLSRLDHIPENADVYPEFHMFGELPCWGFFIRHVKDLDMHNIRISIAEDDYRPAIVLDDVQNIKLSKVQIEGDNKSYPLVSKNSSNIITDSSINPKRL